MTPKERVAVIFTTPKFCPENYKGETDENGMPHGLGVMKYEKKTTYSWLWVMDDDIAPKRYEGQWCHGVRCGEGKMSFYSDNSQHYSYTGQWANDLPEGSGSIRVIDKRGKESITSCNLVAGLREGCNTAVEFGKTIECEWKAGVKEGEGVCTMPNGQQFRGVWHNDNLDLDSCAFMEITQSPTLIVTLYHTGFDYNRRVVALVEGSCGEHTICGSLPIIRDNGFNDSELLIEILSIEDGAVNYRLDARYSDKNTPIFGSITAGESVEYINSHKGEATIYDEDYDYEVICSVKIICKSI